MIHKAIAAIPEGAVLYFPGGRVYSLKSPVELRRSLSLRFEASAVVSGSRLPSLFSIHSGERFVFEGAGGPARLEILEGKQASVIDLASIDPAAAPDLTLRNLHFSGASNVSGQRLKYVESAGSLGALVVEECRFEAQDTHIAFNQGSIRSVRIEDSLFTGQARKGILLRSPITEGAFIMRNRLLNIGITAIQLGGGKSGMVDDGALDAMASVNVHDNQILGGGGQAKEDASYIFGILVYGTNVSIQGNIIRDFHRGEPVPNERIGHHFKLSDGTWHRGPWLHPDGKPRQRLAGAAIYAKAQYGVIANNVCTNSGWRSVIEVKTGGRKPYFLITGNMVDGSSLAIDDSFGFEADTAKALWANNVVVNMPSQAFKSSAGWGTNTFSNNVIADSKIGLSISNASSNADRTMISNNRFVNVETPIHFPDPKYAAVEVAPPTPIYVNSPTALPPATAKERGRLAFIAGERDRLFVVKKISDSYRWVPIRDEAPPDAPDLP